MEHQSALHEEQIPVKIKLAALWTAVMFCYVYGDYFELYVPPQSAGTDNG